MSEVALNLKAKGSAEAIAAVEKFAAAVDGVAEPGKDARLSMEQMSKAASLLGVTLKKDLEEKLRVTESALEAFRRTGQLTGETEDKLKQSIADLKAELSGAGQAAADAQPKHASLFATIFGAQFAYDLARQAGRGFVTFLQGSVDAAMEDERSQKALEIAIESTGRSYGLVGPKLEAFASQMERVTLYTDEQTREASALMVQLTDLDANGIQRAVKGAMGLSTVMGTDLKSAAKLVTQAMEGNYGALSRYGVKVDETLSPQEKQAQLLEQLETMFRRSTGEVDSQTGAVTQLKKAWGNLQEEIGRQLMPSKVWAEIMTGALEAVTEGVKSKKQQMTEAVRAQKAYNDENSATYELLRGVGEAMGWSNVKLYNLTQEFGGSYITLMKWVEAGYFGKEAVEALNTAQDGLSSTQRSYYQTIKELGTPTQKEEAAATELRNRRIVDLKAALAEGVISQKAYREEVEKLTKGHESASSSGETLRDVMKRITDGFIKFKAAVSPAQQAYDAYMESIDTSLPTFDELADEALVKVQEEIDRFMKQQEEVLLIVGKENEIIKELIRNMNDFKPPDEKEWQPWGDAVQKEIDRVFTAYQLLYSGLDSISTLSLNNRLGELENWYTAQKDFIDKSIYNEEQKAALIIQLDSEYEQKKRKVQREAAQSRKALDIAQAITDGARAAIVALKELGPIAGPIMAAVIAAMVAKQISLIKSQPIPLAQGAVFRNPTEFMMPSGRSYVAGEDGIEIMQTEKMLRRIVREEVGRGGEHNGRPIAVTIPVYIGTKKIKEEVWALSQEGIDTAQLRGRRKYLL